MLDVAVHVGSLGAVLIYFWRDIWSILTGMFRALKGRSSPGWKLFLLIVVGSIPVIVAGYLYAKYGNDMLRDARVVAWATLGFGILLYLADRIGMTIQRIEHMGYSSALMIGLAQVLALIPGTSRSGITMTAARILGYERPDAARFSILLSIPAILGAGTLDGLKLYQSGDFALTQDALIAAGLAFVAALVAITLMMAWLKRASFTPFVIYRILLGGGLLAWIYVWNGAPLTF